MCQIDQFQLLFAVVETGGLFGLAVRLMQLFSTNQV